MFPFQPFVIIDDGTDILPFLRICSREKAPLEAINYMVFKLFWADREIIDRQADLPGNRCLAHKPVVRTECRTQSGLFHLLELMCSYILYSRISLQVAGKTNLNRNPFIRDILTEILDISLLILYLGIGDPGRIKEIISMPDTLSIKVGDSLKY